MLSNFIAVTLGLFILVPVWLYICASMITHGVLNAKKKAGENK